MTKKEQHKSDILTAWKFLLLFYQFTGNVNCLIVLITTENKIELLQTITYSKSTEHTAYNDKKLTTWINSAKSLKHNWWYIKGWKNYFLLFINCLINK